MNKKARLVLKAGLFTYNTRPCKTPSFAQFLCQAQILILEILNVFLWIKFSPSLNLSKIEHFSKISATVRIGLTRHEWIP